MSRHRHGRSRMRDTISLVFAFFLSVTLVGIAAVVSLRIGALSKSGIQRAMDSQFFDYELEHVNERAHYYTLPTGIDPSVLEGVFQKDELQQDMMALVEASFDGGDYVPVTANAKDRLMKSLSAFFASQDAVHSDAELQEISDSYTNAIMDLYVETIALPGLNEVGTLNASAVRYGSILLAVLVVLAALLALLIVRLHSHRHRSLRYFAYAVGAAGLMLVVVPLVVRVSNAYVGLNIEPQSVHYLCVTLITHALWSLMAAGATFLLVSVVLAVMSEKRRANAMHRHRSHAS